MRSLLRLPLLAYGFRPFFLACGLFGVVVLPAWLLLYATAAEPLSRLPARFWHGHEMIFGLVVAAMSGFLLSAVPSSTARRGFAGAPLLALGCAWLAGRGVFAAGPDLPLPVRALAELALLPLLAAFLAPPIVRQRNRNMAMLAVLAALWLADAVFLVAEVQGDAGLADRALLAATNIVLLLLTIVGGRIVPAFTGSALRSAGVECTLRSHAWIERALPPVMLSTIFADAWAPRQAASGVLALVLTVLHAWRLTGWRSLRLGGDPMLWVLHLAYAWLPLGFLLKALAIFAGTPWAQFWQHAFAIGAVATMILAVAGRTTLGHTARPLVAGRPVAVAFLLVTLAAVLRVAGPALWPGHYLAVLVAAGACWTAAFGLFVAVFGPMLVAPRVDGRPG